MRNFSNTAWNNLFSSKAKIEKKEVKTLYWLVESNGELSNTVQDLEVAKALILGDYDNEKQDCHFDIEDLQYTITPVMLTQAEYEALDID